MACMTLLATPLTMATTQFARVISCEVSNPRQEQNSERQLLRMNWVVVTGNNGSRTLRTRWITDRDD